VESNDRKPRKAMILFGALVICVVIAASQFGVTGQATGEDIGEGCGGPVAQNQLESATAKVETTSSEE
jgi:hypothetical protein